MALLKTCLTTVVLCHQNETTSMSKAMNPQCRRAKNWSRAKCLRESDYKHSVPITTVRQVHWLHLRFCYRVNKSSRWLLNKRKGREEKMSLVETTIEETEWKDVCQIFRNTLQILSCLPSHACIHIQDWCKLGLEVRGRVWAVLAACVRRQTGLSPCCFPRMAQQEEERKPGQVTSVWRKILQWLSLIKCQSHSPDNRVAAFCFYMSDLDYMKNGLIVSLKSLQ